MDRGRTPSALGDLSGEQQFERRRDKAVGSGGWHGSWSGRGYSGAEGPVKGIRVLILRASSPGALGNISGKLRQGAEGRWGWKREGRP